MPLGLELGMGIMVWRPLASGLLSGKYRPSQDSFSGKGQLGTVKGTPNPAFQKTGERNWHGAALEAVAQELGHAAPQVAVNWAAHQPGVGSVIVGATKLHQLEDNLKALEFQIPSELLSRLNQVSQPEAQFPYTFFGPEIQAMIHGGKPVEYAPAGTVTG